MACAMMWAAEWRMTSSSSSGGQTTVSLWELMIFIESDSFSKIRIKKAPLNRTLVLFKGANSLDTVPP